MSENKRLRVLTNIAGCLLLVSVLHYALDEPTRSALIRTVSRQWNPPSHKLPYYMDDRYPPTIPYLNSGLLHDASFELWDMPPSPILRSWFSLVTIEATDVVKRETELVRHGRSAVRLEHDGVGHCGNLRQELPHDIIPSLRGRWLKFSAWALSTTPGAPCLHIKADDEPADPKACLQNPSGTWQLVTVEGLIGPETTRMLLIIDISREAMGESAGSVYVDDASLVERPPSSEAPSTIAVPTPIPSSSSERR